MLLDLVILIVLLTSYHQLATQSLAVYVLLLLAMFGLGMDFEKLFRNKRWWI